MGVHIGNNLSVDVPNPEDTRWRNWPTANAAAALLQLQPMAIQRLWMTGELTRYKCPDNCYRFDPEQLAQYMQEIEQVPDGKPDPFKDPDVVMKSQEQAMRLLAQAQTHTEKLSELYAGPIETALRLLQKTNERLHERNQDLECKLAEVAELREQMLQQMLDREIVRTKHEASEGRKKEAWELFKKEAPDLFAGLKATIAKGDPKTAIQVAKTIELLKSLDPELVGALKELDVLNASQKDLIDAILNPDGATPTNGAAKPAEETTEPAAEGN